MDKTQYYKNKILVDEPTPPLSKVLYFFYTSKIGGLIRRLFHSHFASKVYGAYQDSHLSKYTIKKFINNYDIDMSEYTVPSRGYRSFNDFFIRRIKPHARPINNHQALITSPADGKLLVIPNISKTHTFFIKQQPFNLKKLLLNDQLTKGYEAGTMVVVRLAPYDYHRFHFPADCTPSKPRRISGILESVNPLVFKSGIQPLTENERHIISLSTTSFDTIIMIPVGAMMVGKIIETYKPSKAYNKGDEAGYFAFGGSSIALLFKPGVITPRQDFIQHSLQGYETCVHMGEAINE